MKILFLDSDEYRYPTYDANLQACYDEIDLDGTFSIKELERLVALMKRTVQEVISASAQR